MPDTIKPKQWPVQSSQHTVNMKEMKPVTHRCCYETNQYLVSKQGKKQITRKQITETMTCSESATSALGLTKQDYSNDTCAADVEQIIFWLANNTVNKISWNNNLFYSQCIGIMQTKRHRWCMLMTLDGSSCSRNICND